jgi:hypothetical protein
MKTEEDGSDGEGRRKKRSKKKKEKEDRCKDRETLRCRER